MWKNKRKWLRSLVCCVILVSFHGSVSISDFTALTLVEIRGLDIGCYKKVCIRNNFKAINIRAIYSGKGMCVLCHKGVLVTFITHLFPKCSETTTELGRNFFA
jgi:hypothetical protein